MGYLDDLAARLGVDRAAAVAPAVSALRESIEQIQVGLLTNLILERPSRVDRSEVTFLADAVLSYATLMPPTQAETIRFSETHRDVIDQVLADLSGNETFATGLSHLYAAITLLLAFETGEIMSELSIKLGERASDLGIDIPDTYAICGSGDAGECIQALAKFADDYREQAFGRR